MFIVNKSELEKIIDFPSAIAEIEKCFVAFSGGKVINPPPFQFNFPNNNGEICIKTALVEGLPTYTIKLVSVFKSNEKLGLSTLTGTMNVFDSRTGKLLAVLNEDGWLTNLRTACAGAIADKYFSLRLTQVLGIIGAGVQARFQAKAILGQNKNYKKVYIFDIIQEKVEKYLEEMQKTFPQVSFSSCESVEELAKLSETILTATPATVPFLKPEMIKDGATIIGVGADMPEKCEFAPDLYVRADKIFVDSRESNLLLGGISRSIKEKKLTIDDITGEIGEVIVGKKQGRQNEQEVIVINLVGIGVQDTFIGNFAFQKFLKQ